MDQQKLDSNILIYHRQQQTLDKLKSGDITDISASFMRPANAIVKFALELGFLQEGFKSFPDPRNSFSVPMDAILLSQTLRSLNDQNIYPREAAFCDSFEEYSLKTLRQKPVVEKNPKIIIYANDGFAVVRILELLPMILMLQKRVREKLANLFRALQLDPAPS